MAQRIIQRGAEAVIFEEGMDVVKCRVKKSYRISEIDNKIRKLRTRGEAKLLERAGKLIDVPEMKRVDEVAGTINMEFVKGKKLSDNLNLLSKKKQEDVALIIGQNISKIHDADIIHGDLTTSNMIFVDEKMSKVFFIDFGLGFISKKIEDKAVDLHLLKQALEAKHFERWEILFLKVLKGYLMSKNYENVLEQLKKVEMRGRYKDKY